MSFGIPVRNGLGIGLLPSTAISTLRIGGRPALILNFIGTDTLDSRITFTRALNTATRINNSGTIEIVNANIARFDYDPTTLVPKGLLIEEARTNLLLNSLINGTSLSTQSVTVSAVAHTISFYGTGTITLTGASVATVTGTGVYPSRKTLTFTPIVGVLVCTVTGSVQYAQLEVGSSATSFISTAATAVTRNADAASMTGTNFSSWYNQPEGTLLAAFSGAGAYAVAMNDGTNNNFTGIANNSTTVIRGITAVAAAARTVDMPTTAGAINKTAFAYKLNDLAGSTNGGTVVTNATAAIPSLTRMVIGTFGSFGFLNGHVRTIAFYNTRLPNTTLRALSV
jgi:hypothetical protein